jgi:hypothetical protein
VKRKKKYTLYTSIEMRDIQRIILCIGLTATLSRKMPMLSFRKKFVATYVGSQHHHH